MKKFILMMLVLTLLSACSAEKVEEPMAEENNVEVVEEIMEEPVEEPMAEEVEVFTEESLAKYNGKDGMPSYVAVDGVVYDVSDVKSWQGPHQGKYEAGKDYSEIMKKAPHGLTKLEGLPIVGAYE